MAFVELWLNRQASPHTRRNYARQITAFRRHVGKPLAAVTHQAGSKRKVFATASGPQGFGGSPGGPAVSKPVSKAGSHFIACEASSETATAPAALGGWAKPPALGCFRHLPSGRDRLNAQRAACRYE
ncbi:site-specific integrase [Methylobacterium nigriterrae]|uniref:site-specific integrase n=1 Tax=Methylobacterium nigriterrae TaxID=3127512 RepID=UPI0030137330